MDKEAQENVWVFPYLWANSWEGDQRFRCLMILSLPQLHKPLLSTPFLVQKSLGCSDYELCPAKQLVQLFLSFFLSTACRDPMCRSHSLPEVKGLEFCHAQQLSLLTQELFIFAEWASRNQVMDIAPILKSCDKSSGDFNLTKGIRKSKTCKGSAKSSAEYPSAYW